jgi:hypothetical protein
MKSIRIFMIIGAAVLAGFALSGNGLAFHDGGVAHCDGCHTMHNSLDNAVNTTDGSGAQGIGVSTMLLKSANATDVCLNCHFDHDMEGTYHVMSDNGMDLSPGGDFYWMTRTFSWTAHGDPFESRAEDHGHNVISDEHGISADVTNTTAPGGTFSADSLACTSCHDPHGTKTVKNGAISESGSYGAQRDDAAGTDVGNFRLLGDDGYNPHQGPITFSEPPPKARAASFFAGPYVESPTKHTDYGVGMSEWCGNCHGDFMAESSLALKHPADNEAHLPASYITNYNTYVKSGDMSSGSWLALGPYESLVPAERGISDTAVLDSSSPAGLGDLGGTPNVMCLSCHRAHASAFQNATRWDATVEFIIDSHPNGNTVAADGPEPDGSSIQEKEFSYYNRDMTAEFGEFQRSLCNKCHAKD